MIKFLHLLPVAAVALSMGWGASAMAASFEIEENFDKDSSFNNENPLPIGWSQKGSTTFYRVAAADYGQTAQSGSYIIWATTMGTSADGTVIYTKPVSLSAGNEASIEFYSCLPGYGNNTNLYNYGFTVYAGTEADVTKMSEIGKRAPAGKEGWEQHKFSFIPGTDGDYYYAIRINKGQLSPGGTMMFDTFFFSGKDIEPEYNDPASTYPGMDDLELDPDNLDLCVELPYYENFSDPTHYDGKGQLPIGWTTTGSVVWRTGSYKGLAGHSGEWYMVAPESTVDRDERAYTPFFNLKKGVTYTIEFASHQVVTILDEYPDQVRVTTINLKVGTQHDADFLPVTMLSVSEDSPNSRWSEHKVTFCPDQSGAYCFCFELEGQSYTGMAFIDNVRITSPVDTERPEPSFAARAIYNLMDSNLITMGDAPMRIVNNTRYATEFTWDTFGDEYKLLPNGDIDVFFTTNGEHSVELTATNSRGSRSTAKVYNVKHLDKPESQIPFMGYDDNDFHFSRNNLIRFNTDPEFDFVGGYNHYYRTFAEKYDFPAGARVAISQISVWMSWLNYRSFYDGVDDQRIRPFSVKIYGADAEGNLDETKLFGSLETTMNQVWGGSGTNEINGRDIVFPEPVNCEGPIYVVFDFSEEMDMDPRNPDISARSYIGLNQVRHAHNITSMYVKPTAVPENSTAEVGKWCPVHDLDLSLKGLGMSYTLWASYDGVASIAIDSVGNVMFAAKYMNGAINVSGTTEGEWLAVYSTDGKCVAMKQASEGSTLIPAPDLPGGIYIVRGDKSATKFVK